MNTKKGKPYEPEYTQLPYNFLSNNNLRKLIRTKGPEYLAYYIVIQDSMASHTKEDFTLSLNEAIDSLRENLYLFNASDDDIKNHIQDLIEAGAIKKEMHFDDDTDCEEERYCIESVAESLENAREAWFTKCVNPLKLTKEAKERLKTLHEKLNGKRREIRKANAQIDFQNAQLSDLLKQPEVDGAAAESVQTHISALEELKKTYYREIHIIKSDIDKIQLNEGGDENDQ